MTTIMVLLLLVGSALATVSFGTAEQDDDSSGEDGTPPPDDGDTTPPGEDDDDDTSEGEDDPDADDEDDDDTPPDDGNDDDEATSPPRVSVGLPDLFSVQTDGGPPVYTVPGSASEVGVSLDTGMSLELTSARDFTFVGEFQGQDQAPEILGAPDTLGQLYDLHGRGYVLRVADNQGSEEVQIGSAEHVVIVAGAGDRVIGPEDSDLLDDETFRNVLIELTGEATYEGSLGSVDIWLSGDGNLVQGGVGNEGILIQSGAHTVQGGGGNDVIDASGGGGLSNQNGTAELSGFLNPAGNLLDGGVGTDELIGSFNDTMTGGEGIDRFKVYFDPTIPAAEDGSATITDFQPALESVTLVYGSIDATATPPADELRDVMSVRESAEGTQILGQSGAVVLDLQGATGLVVVFQSTADGSLFTTADGTPIDRANADVVVERFLETSS